MRIRQNMRRVWKRTVCLFLVLTISSAIVPPEAVLALDISFPELNIEKQEVYSNEVKRAPFVQTIEENPFGDQRNLLNAV